MNINKQTRPAHTQPKQASGEANLVQNIDKNISLVVLEDHPLLALPEETVSS
ncbi:hypothetical protein ACE6H2_016129 [Prunus campanulata]